MSEDMNLDIAWLEARLDIEEVQEDSEEMTGRIVYIDIDQLAHHPDNPRKEYEEIEELADSIKQKGILQNLTVVPADEGYYVVIGNRRLEASKRAGLKKLPCIIAEMTRQEQVSTMLVENMQRADLTVYEQAQGFQMMLDLGDTADDIAKKTGFSKQTVRRRLKMADLDQEILKEVSSRQIAMSDFDKLAQIEDMNERNNCLRYIGTVNFNMETERRVKKQNIAKNLPIIKDALKKVQAKKISSSETWNGNYREIPQTEIRFSEPQTEVKIPQCNEKLFYCLEEDYGRIRFYTACKGIAPVKRPQAEIDREKAMKEANEKCLEISELCRKLRADFVETLTITSKNRDAMLTGVVTAIISMGFEYTSVSSTKMCELAEVERTWQRGEVEKVIEILLSRSTDTFPRIIYIAFGDISQYYHTTYSRQWPEHKRNTKLDLLYAWLTSVGYVMSDEEKAMQDGTHELFRRGQRE